MINRSESQLIAREKHNQVRKTATGRPAARKPDRSSPATSRKAS